MAKRVLTSEIILTAIADGESQSQLARRLGISRQAVSDFCKKRGVVMPRVNGGVRKPHGHEDGRVPPYQAGCQDCRAYRRSLPSQRRRRRQ